MTDLLLLDPEPVRRVLGRLLCDKSTGGNIVWATDMYNSFGPDFSAGSQIREPLLTGAGGLVIQPRIRKASGEQAERTRKNAEVFTPAWVCNEMNNLCDEAWFGYKDVFNCQREQKWLPAKGRIRFPEKKQWQAYVDARRLEITCGEAPYLVSRYDVSTGESISIDQRIGILDRKLRIVGENALDGREWMKWTLRAFQSVYGYEYQGDNLLIARINLLMTFVDYLEERWHRPPEEGELLEIADIISWNIWQMDGLKGTVPGRGMTEGKEEIFCKIFDWRKGKTVLYSELEG